MVQPEALFTRAHQVAAHAHSPYSGVKVGCALIAQSGAIYEGCNVENASYGLTICAERNAIFSAVAAEGPLFRVREMAVVALDHQFPPCGACRQVIAEFATAEAVVWFLQNGIWTAWTMEKLLPATFRLR
jgi:cytidine deaminase